MSACLFINMLYFYYTGQIPPPRDSTDDFEIPLSPRSEEKKRKRTLMSDNISFFKSRIKDFNVTDAMMKNSK